jgi:hypothetical protein
MNPISTAAAGLASGIAKFDSASTQLVASANGKSDADPASAAVEQITAGEQVYAETSVLGAEQKMFKHLLDITV